MEELDKELLKTIDDMSENTNGAYNIRKNGQGIERK